MQWSHTTMKWNFRTNKLTVNHEKLKITITLISVYTETAEWKNALSDHIQLELHNKNGLEDEVSSGY